MKRTLLLFLIPVSFFLSAQDHPNCSKYHRNTFKSSPPSVQASNLRSDTIDVLKYTITLNITDFTTDTIRGNCVVRFTPLMNNINTISLDFLKMIIDSIEINTTNLSYSYNDTLIIVNLPVIHNTGDTSNLTVYYHGRPSGDASGWGGWYNQGNFAYNLGVGFAADPHVYGRVWFPCFDNFVERSKYKMVITSNGGKIAYCNGALTKDTTILADRIRTWELNEEIPTYLASVAVGPYTHVNQTYTSITGPMPVMLTAQPLDTTNMKNSFINLSGALNTFENRYGDYRWNRIGFCLVPFNSGAMEHATNISYPQSTANGNLTYEYLMAHEFSHHWWGDNITCRTQEDMWINEGMASYSEAIFMEGIYGYPNYISYVKNNHDWVVHYCHITDAGYRAISGIPHAYTYGDHVYKKGADVAHTMRGYLGDSLFFLGLKYVQNTFQFSDIDSPDFRDAMTTATGYNMTDFFDDWVLNPGWPHFAIDSFVSVPNGPNFNVTVYVRQKITGAPSLFSNIPLKINFRSASWATDVRNIVMNGSTNNFTFTLPYAPVFAGMNVGRLISDAKTTDEKVIKTSGFHFASNAHGRFRLNVTNASIATDSAYIFIEHNYANPDPFLSWGNPYRLTTRSWKVSGIIPPTFDAVGYITYDGRTLTGGGGGYLDNSIIPTNNLEDSIVLLYRPDTKTDWYEYPWYTKVTGSLTDKWGNITVDSVIAGEYTIGRHDYTQSLPSVDAFIPSMKVYPNPADESVLFETNLGGTNLIRLLDLSGREVYKGYSQNGVLWLGLENVPSGIYFVRAENGNLMCTEKLVVVH